MTLDVRKLNRIVMGLKRPPVARVGVLGTDGDRVEGDDLTNADIGKIHEFGDETHPQRSFLRVPISDKMQGAISKSKGFDPESLRRIVATGSVRAWVEKIGILAEGIVFEAFQSRGFGKWKPSNMVGKTNKETLVETTQLRDSITSDVVEASK